MFGSVPPGATAQSGQNSAARSSVVDSYRPAMAAPPQPGSTIFREARSLDDDNTSSVPAKIDSVTIATPDTPTSPTAPNTTSGMQPARPAVTRLPNPFSNPLSSFTPHPSQIQTSTTWVSPQMPQPPSPLAHEPFSSVPVPNPTPGSSTQLSPYNLPATSLPSPQKYVSFPLAQLFHSRWFFVGPLSTNQ